MRPDPNALAILQCCHRARKEIGDTWIGQILFSFDDPNTKLNKLTALPPGILPKIRYPRVFGESFVRVAYGSDALYYRLASALTLLPCLRLDTLTVPGPREADEGYVTLTGLITESCGWKELRYVSHTSALLGFPLPADEYERRWYWRKPQPKHWQSVLEERDGVLSRPSVAIYRSTMADRPGSVLNANLRTRFEQEEDRNAPESFGITQDAVLMSDGERGKEIIIIVKRGTAVDYEQKKDSPFISRDIRRDPSGKTWKEIRYKALQR